MFVFLISTIVFFSILILAIVLLICYIHPSNKIKYLLRSNQSLYLPQEMFDSGRSFIEIETFVGDKKERAILQIYYSNGIVNESEGTLSFSGRFFDAVYISTPQNRRSYLLKITSNVGYDLELRLSNTLEN